MPLPDILLLVILLLGGLASAITKKLTWPAALTGVVLGYFIYKGCGLISVGLLAAFFLLGTLATSWGYRQKNKLGIAEERGGRRTAGQVFANAGVAGIAGFLFPDFSAISTHISTDDCRVFFGSSGRYFIVGTGQLVWSSLYNVLTFKKDQRGLNGVISLEGTLCGIAGSAIIAVIYSVGFGWSSQFFLIIIAGAIGNLADSVLGATVRTQGLVGK